MHKVVLSLLVAVMLMAGTISIQPAAAGSNGQQLQISVGCAYAPAVDWVEVTGYNNTNQLVTNRWSFPSGTRSFTTWGYWWKTYQNRNVTVTYHYVGRNPYSGYAYPPYGTVVYAPPTYGPNVYLVDVTHGQGCNAYQHP